MASKATNIQQDLCTFVYQVDERRSVPGVPIADRQPLMFTGIFLGHVTEADYRRNDRGARGTRTATLSAEGLSAYRRNWIYLTNELRAKRWAQQTLNLPML